MHSAWFRSTFLSVFKFLHIKEGGANFLGEPILHKVWIIWSPLLYFNFESFMDPASLSSIKYQCIVHDSGVLFLRVLKFYQLKREDLISRRSQSCRNSELVNSPFSISILKVWRTQILCYWLDFNAFCVIQQYLSKSCEISTN